MTNAKLTGAVLLLTAALVAGCGASKPQPPRSICGIKTPASAITPLLPEEGEQVTQKKPKAESGRVGCLIYIDDLYYFKIQHDVDNDGYPIPSDIFTSKKPRSFQGKLGIDELQAVATATCPGQDKTIFADITLTIAESDKLYADARKDLEKFLNAYMPGVQKHYGCKD